MRADVDDKVVQCACLPVDCGAALAVTGMMDIAVHVPLDVADAVFVHDGCDPFGQIIEHVAACQIERQLMARCDWFSAFCLQHPVGMRAVKVAVGIDHFRFEPQAEFHAQFADAVGDLAKTLGVHIAGYHPVAKAGAVAAPRAEPSIIQHKPFRANFGRLLCQRQKFFRRMIEIDGFPRVEMHRSGAPACDAGPDVRAAIAVQAARHIAVSIR